MVTMIVITTPTGTIGASVAESLYADELPLRVIARDPSALAQTLRSDADVIAGSHSDPIVLDAALSGADAVFVLVPPDLAAVDVAEHYLGFARPIARAVRDHGVPRVVAVSSLGRGFAGPAGMLSAAWAMDEVLESSGAAYRSLQPAFFMENLLHQASLIREQGVFVLPAEPDRPLAAAATADIARTAAGLLADPTWTGQDGVPVREPVDHTPNEMAQIMSDTLGRTIRFRQTSLDEYGAQYAAFGASPASITGMIEMAEAQAAGVYPSVAPGGIGTGFAEWCELVLRPELTR
ncbi:NmrA family NAD(P)-binding protein [Agromyces larvae]|uniref:NAD(P)H-binding protein n=1 Tax=Agromyces larvae TaxID=2929802 RepID=A0ABY4C4E3_9MICO|nr:NAD(P)H-binding protein [Agromyces larvae]UOE45839.1 NAD(P)H-binding protein [Agromyces larvae]